MSDEDTTLPERLRLVSVGRSLSSSAWSASGMPMMSSGRIIGFRPGAEMTGLASRYSTITDRNSLIFEFYGQLA